MSEWAVCIIFYLVFLHGSTYLPIYFPSPSYLPYVPLPKKKKR